MKKNSNPDTEIISGDILDNDANLPTWPLKPVLERTLSRVWNARSQPAQEDKSTASVSHGCSTH